MFPVLNILLHANHTVESSVSIVTKFHHRWGYLGKLAHIYLILSYRKLWEWFVIMIFLFLYRCTENLRLYHVIQLAGTKWIKYDNYVEAANLKPHYTGIPLALGLYPQLQRNTWWAWCSKVQSPVAEIVDQCQEGVNGAPTTAMPSQVNCYTILKLSSSIARQVEMFSAITVVWMQSKV